MEKTLKHYIHCSCNGIDFIQMLKLDWDEGDELYIRFAGTEMPIKQRLKAIWKIIRYGEFENDGILADENSIKDLIEYLEKVLKSWNEKSDFDKLNEKN